MPAIERAGLIVTDIEVLRMHYAETLQAWRERFQARREEAKALYDERFCRMWEFYLAGSEVHLPLSKAKPCFRSSSQIRRCPAIDAQTISRRRKRF